MCSDLVQMQEPRHSLDFIIEQFREFPSMVSVKEISFSKEHPNVIIIISKGKGKKKVVISGHVDVGGVGNRDDWRFDPFSGKILRHHNDLIVYGRGSSDMKGGIVSALIALRRLLAQDKELDCDIYLVLTSDEEVGGYNGIRKILSYIPLPDFCIIPEPTSMVYYSIGEKGVIRGELSINSLSLQDFVSLSQEIRKCAPKRETLSRFPEFRKILHRSERLFGTLGSYEKLDHFHLFYEHVTSSKSEISLEIPYLDDKTPLIKCIEKLRNKLGGRNLEFFEYIEPNTTSPSTILCRLLEKNAYRIFRKKPLPIFSFCTSEAPFFRAYGVPTILYGPGEMALSHKINEFIRASRIVQCAKILEAVLDDYGKMEL